MKKRYHSICLFCMMLLSVLIESTSTTNAEDVAKQEQNYQKASAALSQGKYSEAYNLYKIVGDYKDSYKKSEEARTARMGEGHALANDGKLEEAYEVFKEVASWNCHEEYAEVDALEPAYFVAATLFAMGKYEDAASVFEQLGNYSDSPDMLRLSKGAPIYIEAVGLYEEEKYQEAKSLFDSIGDIRDSAEYSAKCAVEIEKEQAVIESEKSTDGDSEKKKNTDAGGKYKVESRGEGATKLDSKVYEDNDVTIWFRGYGENIAGSKTLKLEIQYNGGGAALIWTPDFYINGYSFGGRGVGDIISGASTIGEVEIPEWVYNALRTNGIAEYSMELQFSDDDANPIRPNIAIKIVTEEYSSVSQPDLGSAPIIYEDDTIKIVFLGLGYNEWNSSVMYVGATNKSDSEIMMDINKASIDGEMVDLVFGDAFYATQPGSTKISTITAFGGDYSGDYNSKNISLVLDIGGSWTDVIQFNTAELCAQLDQVLPAS